MYEPSLPGEPPSYEALAGATETTLEMGERTRMLQRRNQRANDTNSNSQASVEASATSSSTAPVRYTFSRISDNSMILVPPPSAPAAESHPLYHISVTQNLFNPFSYVTTIHRGGTENGEFVAEFEHGIAQAPATIYMKGVERTLWSVLTKNGPHSRGVWTWIRSSGSPLIWDCEWEVKKVTLGNRPGVLAKFAPAPSCRKKNKPAKVAQLEVHPDGQQFFDDILISALAIERMRDIPSRIVNKGTHLFSYQANSLN